MYKPNNTPTPAQIVPQLTSKLDDDFIPTGTPMGAFAGYLRRPKSSSQGLTAQFFGENGPDADTICALHLTRYQEALVKVSVWGLKDSDGKLLRGNDGKSPLLTEFIARVRRPAPSMPGQTALFFGENGPNADAINILNETRVLDSLVYVEITKADPGQTPAEITVATPDEALAEQQNRLTPVEIKSIQQQQRKAAEARRLLRMAQFFMNEVVWSTLGSEQQFHAWVGQQSCCHPGNLPCDQSPIVAHKIPGGKRYGVVPLCREHAVLWDRGEGTSGAQQPLAFLETRRTSLVQRWAEDRLHNVLKVPNGFDPTPQAILDWAVINKLSHIIPRSFDGLL